MDLTSVTLMRRKDTYIVMDDGRVVHEGRGPTSAAFYEAVYQRMVGEGYTAVVDRQTTSFTRA